MNAPAKLAYSGTTHLLHRAGQLAEDIFSRSIGDLGITARQYVVLSVVDGLDDPSQTTLCEISGIDRSTLADIVRRLVERGLLARRRTRVGNVRRRRGVGTAVTAGRCDTVLFLEFWESLMGSAFTRKVQITRDEFLRQLPGAIGGLDHRTNENDIVIGEGAKLIRIRLTELGVEELGSLELPMQQVDFTFENMAGEEIDTFMTRWDEHKLRMGG